MMHYFEMDDDSFLVDLMAFERHFEPELTDHAGTAADGSFYYEDKGLQQLLRVEFRARPGCEEDLERLWQSLQLGGVRGCTFPAGSGTEPVYAYVTACSQALASTRGTMRWDSLRVTFRVVQDREDDYGA